MYLKSIFLGSRQPETTQLSTNGNLTHVLTTRRISEMDAVISTELQQLFSKNQNSSETQHKNTYTKKLGEKSLSRRSSEVFF